MPGRPRLPTGQPSVRLHGVWVAQGPAVDLDEVKWLHYVSFMNLTRLVVLGLLAEHGQRHGHQLRRDVEVRHADDWAGVGIGSLHRELRAMSDTGLIQAVRTERVDNRPERTIYQITSAGRKELAALRARAIGEIQPTADAMSVALIFTGALDPAVLGELLTSHRLAVVAEQQRLADERRRGMEQGYLQPSVSPTAAAAFRRAELHVQAERQWHLECDQWLTTAHTVTAGPDAPAAPGR